MPSDQTIYAGVEFSSGRNPVTFAALDHELNITYLESWNIPQALACLEEHDSVWLAMNLPTRESEAYNGFRKKIIQSGFKFYSNRQDLKQFLVTNAQDCFRIFAGHKLLPRRSLEGRLQRSAILYEQELQIKDPIDVFEEITRFKLIQGILPLEHIYASKELDALMAAYLAWMAVNRPGHIVLTAEFALPAQE